MLRSGRLDGATAARALESVERNTRLQAHIIEDLLDVSRITSGKLRIEPDAVYLASVVNAAVDVVRPAAEAKGVQLSHVDIRLAQTEAEAVVTVTDTGPGVSAESPAPHLRALPSGRQQHHLPARRARARAGPRPAPGRAARRRGGRRQPGRGARRPLHGDAPSPQDDQPDDLRGVDVAAPLGDH